MECNICNKKTDYLEIHHIVPKSRGGLDTKQNMVGLCIECHSLAHDVSFKRKNGLIAEAAQRAIQKTKDAQKWCNENEDLMNEKIENLFYENEDLAHFVSYTIKYWNAVSMMDWVVNDNISFKVNINTKQLKTKQNEHN